MKLCIGIYIIIYENCKETLKKIRKKNYININTFSMLRKEIKLLPNKLFYWNTCGYFFLSSIIDRYLSFIGGKKINIESGSQPDFSKDIKKNYIHILEIHYKKNKYYYLIKLNQKSLQLLKILLVRK